MTSAASGGVGTAATAAASNTSAAVDGGFAGLLGNFINGFLGPTVCVFGVLGNGLNLVVLTRRRLQRSMDGLERSVRIGLVALAVSDAAFCLLYLLATLLLPTKAKYSPHDSRATLYFGIYHEGLINVFQVSSTWLTVNMALGRYIAICHPLHARGYINSRGTRLAVVAIFVGSALFNLPRFWHYRANETPCHWLLGYQEQAAAVAYSTTASTGALGATGRNLGEGWTGGHGWNTTVVEIAVTPASRPQLQQLQIGIPPGCQCFYYSKATGQLYKTMFRLGYGLACSVVEIFLPLLLLTICNACLIRALRRSHRMQTMYRTHQKPIDSVHRITPTLIALIVLFTLLVTPSHLLGFVTLTVGRPSSTSPGGATGSSATFKMFEAAVNITNFLLLTNFAVNFVLYLVVNADFRRAARDLITCRRVNICRRRRHGSAAGVPAGSGATGVRYWAAGSRSRALGVAAHTTDMCNLSDTDTAF